MTGFSRRTILKAGFGALNAVSVSGCLAGGRFNRFLVRGAPLPDALDATIALTVTDIPTIDRPVSIRVEFTNEADDSRAYRISQHGWFPVGPETAENEISERSTPERMILSRKGEGNKLVDRCWKQVPTQSYDDADGGEWIVLAPGETVTGDRVLLNHERNRECYPIGLYRFEERFWTKVPGSGDERDPFKWKFSVRILESGVGSPPPTAD